MIYILLFSSHRLLDMGFDREIAVILNALNEQAPDRQTILLSATLTDDVKRLAGIALKEPRLIDIAQELSRTISAKSTEKQTSEENSEAETRTRNTVAMETESNLEVKESDEGDIEVTELKQSDFTTPEGLQQHFVIVPSKLRLVTLTAFILWRCTVSLFCII